jgi:polar amino acid transport system substrate-binding protein
MSGPATLPKQPSVDLRPTLAPTGTLRASINLGNPVLAQGSEPTPTGVSVDIARELARQLEVPLQLLTFRAARDSFEATRDGRADISFLAIDRDRERFVMFTTPYAVIEGVYAVPKDSPITTCEGVDRPGVRIGVKEGSAYDLHLTRSLRRAQVVRGEDGVVVFLERKLEAAAGIRQPVTEFIARVGGLRLIEPSFMEIRQAVSTSRDRGDVAIRFLNDFVEGLKARGFIADSLRRSGRDDATVAPPGP